MQQIFVDTCTWWHWFCYHKQDSRLTSQHEKESRYFQKIYEFVINNNDVTFVFNQKVINELDNEFSNDVQEKILPFSSRVPIPLTRMDGSYKYDGSFLYGGKSGESLRDLLSQDGYDHTRKLKEDALLLLPGEYLYHKKSRQKEFDIEHMESALECGAILFITTDEKTILRRLERAAKLYDTEHPINQIKEIAKLPSQAFQCLISSHNNFS